MVGSGVAARGSHAEPVEVVVPAEPSAVLALNRGVAVAMADGPATALPLLDTLVTDPALARSHRVWSVRRICCGGWVSGSAPPRTTTARSRW